ncbi:hypothetical protein DRW48_12400 [Paracoccus suum]|uniref:Prohead serine protease domain-containing protein n=1 Tax=Paracoccus suum TaxID=2259340 RepID=A0A344PLX5_9RHOB|nr:HK97 family phage prohead protease [Paracoccus suum]AXC50380.1 hypothetical protein DRW48_12400 [Paracoccus suum]
MTGAISHVYPVEGLEVRQQGGRPTIFGRFPYNSLATMSDRGTVRKETIKPGAFGFAIGDLTRDIHLLLGHDFNRPLASRKAGSLTLQDTDDFLEFVASIPEGADRASHVTDALAMLGAGLIAGVSPGFRVPPSDVVPDAEKLVPEPGNPRVMIRQLFKLVLFELSLVTRPAYEQSRAELRALDTNPTRPPAWRNYIW